jgi:TonB family protein
VTFLQGRAAPWVVPLVVSLVVHAGILLVPVSLAVTDRGRPEERRIDLVFDMPAARAAVSPRAASPREPAALPSDSAPSVPRPAADTPALPPRPLEERPAVSFNPDAVLLVPAARDVLADMPAASAPVAAPVNTSVTADALPRALEAPADVSLTEARIAWQGSPRAVIRRPEPEFPRVLSRAGQEAEGALRITVSPSGTVTKVEVVQPSGYPEIDVAVVGAVRNWLFAKAEGKTDAPTVSFRFRLGRRD